MNDDIRLDPAHENMPLFEQEIVKSVWADKYKYLNEAHPNDTFWRVANGIYAHDKVEHREHAYKLMKAGLWIPAGRIMAGAGTEKNVTLMNCYVMGTIDDSMEGIFEELKKSALTLRMGGGIGMDFSTLRPRGARLVRLGAGAMSSGAVSFMDNWNTMCKAIMSAGARRGAMMGTLADWHPDLLEFIEAKQEKGRLTNFNVSILISDAFMEAVKDDALWALYFHVPHVDGNLYSFEDEGKTQYVYKEIRARELWEKITRLTYEYSEPGVIFIDRVNDLNNLQYCENIRCTNPCGEQPLPPYGTCNLGAVNLARMIRKPFTAEASIDMELLHDTVTEGVRFLDNVIDVTAYPLEQQQQEEISKRRIGIGITGLGNALMELGYRYGSPEAVTWTHTVMNYMANIAYEASIQLAKERGVFPLYNAAEFLKAPFLKNLQPGISERIQHYGIRNGVLLTVAPTGTTSIAFGGNCSSGIEPVFAHQMTRKVRQVDDSWKPYVTYDYGYLLYHKVKGIEPGSAELPSFMATAQELSIQDHLEIQGAVQKYIDASVSKTINVPTETSYEEFCQVYEKAYALGAKGCTTYRPSDVRGSILEAVVDKPPADAKVIASAQVPEADTLIQRPETLDGKTVKLKWPTLDSAIYITVNYLNGKPFEVFISSKDHTFDEWTTAMTLMISAILRRGGDISFIPQELQQVESAHNQHWMEQKHFKSIVAYIGFKLKQLFDAAPAPSGDRVEAVVHMSEGAQINNGVVQGSKGKKCPKCHEMAVIKKEGCEQCTNCDYSKCG